jgi:hypothetical protein
MIALPSIFVENDRVHITDGPMHGFNATVLAVAAPGKLALAVDGFSDRHPIIVPDENVELCDGGAHQLCAPSGEPAAALSLP